LRYIDWPKIPFSILKVLVIKVIKAESLTYRFRGFLVEYARIKSPSK